jgi:lipopolysaccharide/colanic/teichoic acid biosynthesis glycosyltransferase
MTGLWQVSGRNDTSYEERVALDRHYVESRSLVSDVVILLRTVKVVLLREGAR